MTVIRSPGTKLRSPGCSPAKGCVAVTTISPVAPPSDDPQSTINKNKESKTETKQTFDKSRFNLLQIHCLT